MQAETARTDPHAELERARSDYLAVSRGGHMYASRADHDRAEQRAWRRLEDARRATEGHGAPSP